jgi:hypothetical protein
MQITINAFTQTGSSCALWSTQPSAPFLASSNILPLQILELIAACVIQIA